MSFLLLIWLMLIIAYDGVAYSIYAVGDICPGAFIMNEIGWFIFIYFS